VISGVANRLLSLSSSIRFTRSSSACSEIPKFWKNLKFYLYKFDQRTEAFQARFSAENRNKPAGHWRTEKNRLWAAEDFFSWALLAVTATD